MQKLLSLLGVIALALVAAAALASSAQSARPDDRAGLLGVGGADATTDAVRPDDRPGPRVVATAGDVDTTIAVRPDDRPGARWPVVISDSQMPPVAVPGKGFAWEDATVGAAITIGVFLLAGALALSVRHRRRLALP